MYDLYKYIYYFFFLGNVWGLCEKSYFWWYIGVWLWGIVIYIINILFKDNNLKLRGNIIIFVLEV